MPIRTPIQKGEIYHVYNRGIEKRDIFIEKLDNIRFIHDLFEFNTTAPAPDFKRRYTPGSYVGRRESHIGEKIVEILCFCLMENHYHLLIRPIKDNAIPLFMNKLGTGYVNAFNAKNERVGPLFQSRYKAKHVDREEYLKNIICYIHANPLKFLKKFKKNKTMDFERTWESLKKYRWSSHLDYLGEDNFGSVIEKKFILDLFGGVKGYEEYMRDYIKNEAERIETVRDFAIDLDD